MSPIQERKSIGVVASTHERFRRMQAEAMVKKYAVESADDALRLLLDVWEQFVDLGLFKRLVPAKDWE